MPPLPIAAADVVQHRLSSALLEGFSQWWQMPLLVAALAAVAAGVVWMYRRDAVELPRLYILYHLPPFGSDGMRRAEILASLMTTGLSGRLVRRMVIEKKVAVKVSGWVLPTELSGSLIFVVTLARSVSPAEGLALFDETLESVVSSPPDEEEWQKALFQIRKAFQGDLDNLSDRADLISMSTTFFDDPEWAFSEMDRYRGLDEATFPDWVKERFVNATRAVLTFIPEIHRG